MKEIQKKVLYGILIALLLLVISFGDDIRNADGFGYLGLAILSVYVLMAGGIGVLLSGILLMIFRTHQMKSISAYFLGGSLGILLFGTFLHIYIRSS